MKNIIAFFIYVIVVVILLHSCKKREKFYPMHAIINGVVFNGTNCVADQSGNSIYGGVFTGSNIASVTPPYIGIGFSPAIVTYYIQ